jgi:hypothetical protein
VSQAAVASSAVSGGVTSTPERPTGVSPLEVEQLLANWTALYNLGNDPAWVKGSVTPSDVLPAPHLQVRADILNRGGLVSGCLYEYVRMVSPNSDSRCFELGRPVLCLDGQFES